MNTPVLPGIELPPARSTYRPGYRRYRGRLMPHRPINHDQFNLPLQETLQFNKVRKFTI